MITVTPIVASPRAPLVPLPKGEGARRAGEASKVSPLRRFVHALALLVAFAPKALAGGPGTTTGELLKIPIGARAIGMGEAYTALADDSSALAWNPAGLARVEQHEASFMHSSLIENIHYEHLAYVAPGDSYSLGASMSYLGYGDIAGYNNKGEAIGNQTAYAYNVTGGVAREVQDNLSVGLAAEFLRETLADESAGTLALNAGAQYGVPQHPWGGDYRLGLSLLHLGPGLKFVTDRDPLPRKIKLGASASHIKNQPLNLTMDVTVPNDNSTYVSLGSEYWFRNILALRLGYIGSNDEGSGIRLGFGLQFHGLAFDYAYGGFGDFGATHRIGLTFRFGERIQQLNKDEKNILKEAKAFHVHGDYAQAILSYNDLLDKRPADDRILRFMVKAHEEMVQKELGEAVAEITGPVPSLEEAALSDLAPGQDVPGLSMMMDNNKGNEALYDPLGLDNLPDLNGLEDPARPGRSSRTPLIGPSSKLPRGTPDLAAAPAAPSAIPGEAALSPMDIYGR